MNDHEYESNDLTLTSQGDVQIIQAILPRMIKKLSKAIASEDSDAINNILNSQELDDYIQHSFHDSIFGAACFVGNMALLSTIFTKSHMKSYRDELYQNLWYGLGLACQSGQLNVVKYLLTSPELEEHANIHHLDDLPLQIACQCGHLEVFDYLLNSPDLKEHCSLKIDFNGFNLAFTSQQFHIIEYILDNDLLTRFYINKTVHFEHYFEDAVHLHYEFLIQYFIVNDYVVRDEFITEVIADYPEIQKLFDSYELNKHLKENLSLPSLKFKKNKI